MSPSIFISYKNPQTAAKDQRAIRSEKLQNNEHFVIEMASFALGIDDDELIQCAIDTEDHVEVIKNIFKPEGSRAFLLQYQLSEPPAAGSKF